MTKRSTAKQQAEPVAIYTVGQMRKCLEKFDDNKLLFIMERGEPNSIVVDVTSDWEGNICDGAEYVCLDWNGAVTLESSLMSCTSEKGIRRRAMPEPIVIPRSGLGALIRLCVQPGVAFTAQHYPGLIGALHNAFRLSDVTHFRITIEEVKE